jgi:riboflavin biosynthesis pyrimidine reductase
MSAVATKGLAAPAARSLPSRARPRGDERIEALFDASLVTAGAAGDSAIRGGLTDVLRDLYGGDLAIPLRRDRPTVVANFVETIDGAVALDRAGVTGGGDVSGFSPTDRSVMGLLRALADVVIVGAETVRGSRTSGWRATDVFPGLAPEYAALRRKLGLVPHPTAVLVTSSGRLAADHPAFATGSPALIATTESGASRLLATTLPAHVEVVIVGSGARVEPVELLDVLAGRGARLALTEGGPTLLASFLEAGACDELFLTVAPQVAGRSASTDRLGLVEGAALWPQHATWADLISVRRAGSHLFLRYRFEGSHP